MSQSVPLAFVLCQRISLFPPGEHSGCSWKPQIGWKHGPQRTLRRVRLAGAGDAFKDLGLTWPLAVVSLLRSLVVSPGSLEPLGSVLTVASRVSWFSPVGCPLCLQVSGAVWK